MRKRARDEEKVFLSLTLGYNSIRLYEINSSSSWRMVNWK
jgi:hypothetical protein